jgi:3-isopropylmalate dehydrogenase
MKASIALLPGDGIGPEVVNAAVTVLECIATRYHHQFDMSTYLMGGCAIDACGIALPEETKTACIVADAVLLGAVGGPQWSDPKASIRPEQGLLQLRALLNVFANVRPLKVFPRAAQFSPLKAERLEGVDFVFVRELTGGSYFGKKTRTEDAATDECRYTVLEVERVAHKAFQLAQSRRKKVTSIDKANVLETSRLWRETVTQVATHYPDVVLEHQLVDSMAMLLLTRPADYDVLLTENLFGDILTDEAAVLAGSLGLLPSASLGMGSRGLYEPIHGSAPDIAGQSIANPIGCILSAALMLRYSFGLEHEAQQIERAVSVVIEQSELTRDLFGQASTQQITQAVLTEIHLHAESKAA